MRMSSTPPPQHRPLPGHRLKHWLRQSYTEEAKGTNHTSSSRTRSYSIAEITVIIQQHAYINNTKTVATMWGNAKCYILCLILNTSQLTLNIWIKIFLYLIQYELNFFFLWCWWKRHFTGCISCPSYCFSFPWKEENHSPITCFRIEKTNILWAMCEYSHIFMRKSPGRKTWYKFRVQFTLYKLQSDTMYCHIKCMLRGQGGMKHCLGAKECTGQLSDHAYWLFWPLFYFCIILS